MGSLRTTKEVAEQFSVSQSTVSRWVKDGSLRAVRVGELGHLRFEQEELDRFLEDARVRPAAS